MSDNNKGGGGLELLALGAWVGILFCTPFTPNRARVTLRALIIGGAVFLCGLVMYGIHDTAVRIYHLEHQNGAFLVDLLALPLVMGWFPYKVVCEVWGDKFFEGIPEDNLKAIQYLLCFAFYASLISFLIHQLPK